MSLNSTFCPFQVWISWSSFRATRTRRSIRKPSTWSSATSTRRTKTRRWLPPSTCSSSSSSSSSARPRWKASSYNPAPPASGVPLTIRSFVSLDAHRQTFKASGDLGSLLIDLIIMMIRKENTNHRSALKCLSLIWVKSCQPVRQGLSKSVVLALSLPTRPEPPPLVRSGPVRSL